MAQRFIRGHLFRVDGVRYHRIAVYQKEKKEVKKIEDIMFQLPLTEAEIKTLKYKIDILM